MQHQAQQPQARLEDIVVEEVSLVDRAANKRKFLVVKRDQVEATELVSDGRGGFVVADKAVWSTAFVNDLPDSAFLYIAPGGSKDEAGRTVPRDLRYFPVRDPNGAIDLPHLRNALARIPQANIPADVKERLMAEAQKLLENANKVDAAPAAAEPEAKADDAAGVVAVENGCAGGAGKPKRKEDEQVPAAAPVVSPEAKADEPPAADAQVAAPVADPAPVAPEAPAPAADAPVVDAAGDEPVAIDPTMVGKAVGYLAAVHKGAKLAKPRMAKLRNLYVQLSDLLKELEPEAANDVIARAVEATTQALVPHFAAAHALAPKGEVAVAAAKVEEPPASPMDAVLKQLAELRTMVTESAAAGEALRKENSELRGLVTKQAGVLRDASLHVQPSQATPVESSGAAGEPAVVWPRDLNNPLHRGTVTKARSFHG